MLSALAKLGSHRDGASLAHEGCRMHAVRDKALKARQAIFISNAHPGQPHNDSESNSDRGDHHDGDLAAQHLDDLTELQAEIFQLHHNVADIPNVTCFRGFRILPPDLNFREGWTADRST